jgi:hypothetical protein
LRRQVAAPQTRQWAARWRRTAAAVRWGPVDLKEQSLNILN